MIYSKEKLDDIAIHFVLCTERTGSSLFSMMLNLHSEILSPSEEPFALYFWRKYRHKTKWSEKDISSYVDQFFAIAEKNLDLYFSKKEVFLKSLLHHREFLNYNRIVKLTYLHFLDTKSKSHVSVIVDKQIKYFFHLKSLRKIFPDARYIILVRDVRDNIISKQKRALNWNQHPLFLAGLWRDTYSNMRFIREQDRCVIQYEQLIADTRSSLIKTCSFLGVKFDEKMLKTDGVYASFLEQKEGDVDADFLHRLRSFHSGLSDDISDSKIGQYKMVLEESTLLKVEQICGEWLRSLGYPAHVSKKVKGLSAIYYTGLAKLYRKYLLAAYKPIPLGMKLFVKRRKNSSKSV